MAYTPHNKPKSKNDKRDRYDWITLGTAVVGVVVVAASAAIAAWTAVLMREQVNQMQAQVRPWLQVIDAVPEPLFKGISYTKDGSLLISPTFKVKNVGQAVAIGTFVAIKVIPQGDDISPLAVIEKQNAFCDGTRKETYRNPRYLGVTIFPGTEEILSDSDPDNFTVPSSEIKKAVLQYAGKKYLRLSVIGCVDYGFYANPRRFQTWFSYDVSLKGVPMDLVPAETVISSTEIALQKHISGNGYAD